MSAQSYKRYAAYKDSGVEWLGEIPAGWEVKRLKEIATIQMSNVDKKSVEGEQPVELCNYTDVYYRDRISSDIDFMKATAPREQIRRFALRAGDVLITKDSESWTDIAVPAVVDEDLPNVLCGYHLAHIRPLPAVYGPYLARAISAVGPRDQFRVAANGVTRFAIGTDAITTAVFAIPTVAEQRAIAAFLDRETARIDALVAKKARLIELLQERRTALITRAVTKGLDPAVPNKDSGVDWLGDVPAHWGVVPLKRHLTSVEQGWSPLAENRIADAEEWAVLKVGCVNGGRFDETENKALPSTFDPIPALEIRVGDVLVSRANTRELLGSAALVESVRPQLLLCDKLYRLSVRSHSLNAAYLVIVLASHASRYQMEIEATGASSSMQNIAQETVRELLVTIPPMHEQLDIVAGVNRETVRLDALIAKVRYAITHLHELRTALIGAAVTGKIDVREAVQ